VIAIFEQLSTANEQHKFGNPFLLHPDKTNVPLLR
jgi:hypothetical protein